MGPLGIAIIAGSTIAAGALSKPKESATAKRMMEAALHEFGSLNPPTAEELSYSLEPLIQQGILTPEEAQAFIIDKTSYEDISVDPELKAAQMRALAKLQNIVESGGLDAQSRARLAEITMQEGARERGQREAILQNAAQRGVSGSGLEIASAMGAQQEGATRQSMQDVEVAADAEKRALEALSQYGALGGQMRGQEFGEQAAVAAAKDAINKFNVANRQNVELTNVGARNVAQERNLAEKQRISEANVGNLNEMARRKADVAQQMYQNAMQRAAGMSGQYTKAAEQAQAAQTAKDKWLAGMIGTGANLVGSYYGAPKAPVATTGT
jgi:hypothetical protein